MDDEYFSIEHEPTLSGQSFEPDPAEHRAAPTDRPADEMETLRDSVDAEPALAAQADFGTWQRWIDEKRSRCTLAGNLTVTLLAALLTGPLAIVGAVLTGRPGISGAVYAIVFGPVTEELLKQSGMVFLLEKKPYRLFASWQFIFAAIVAGLAFGTIENLFYIHYYGPMSGVKDLAALAAFRWTLCMPLHAVWAAIASVGLIRVWKRQLHDGKPADLSVAFPWFVAAMVLHGLYNLGAMFVEF